MFRDVKVGIMGCGNIAGMMATTLKKAKGAKLYAVASRSAEKAARFAAEHDCKLSYGSYEELCADKDVQLVYIATPHSEHLAGMKLAMEHGKHVLCEKAFTLNEGEAREAVDLAKEKGVLLCEAIWPRFMPFVQTIKETIAEGWIGTPQVLTANLGYLIHDKERLFDPALGGGALLDVGIYPLTFASLIFGDEITSVTASGTKNRLGADERDVISLTYADGRVADIMCTTRAVTDRRGIIYGDKGYMVVDNINNFEGLTVYDLRHEVQLKKKRPRQHTGYEYEVSACAKAIREGKTLCEEAPPELSITMMRLMDTIRKQIGVVYAPDAEY